MTTKEDDFKKCFVTVLRDLQQDGTKDPQIVLAVGALAAAMAKELNSTTWSAAKRNITVPIYDQLLKKLQQSGEAHYRAGRHNEAYAIQVLSFSLIVRTQSQDGQMVGGEALIDQAIDRALAAYQQTPKATAH